MMFSAVRGWIWGLWGGTSEETAPLTITLSGVVYGSVPMAGLCCRTPTTAAVVRNEVSLTTWVPGLP